MHVYTYIYIYKYMHVFLSLSLSIYMFIYIYIYILQGFRPIPPTRTLNTSRLPDRLQVTAGGPRNQKRDQSIVQAHSMGKCGCLERSFPKKQRKPIHQMICFFVWNLGLFNPFQFLMGCGALG